MNALPDAYSYARIGACAPEPEHERKDPMNRDTTIWWSVCDNCAATLAVWPHPDRETDVPNPDEWEGFWPSCPVCEETMNWEGADTPADMIRSFQSVQLWRQAGR